MDATASSSKNQRKGGEGIAPRPSQKAIGKRPAATPAVSVADAPKRPALWPWQWMGPEHGHAIAHAQGCALCDAYLDHLDVERELGVRSLLAAEDRRIKQMATGEYARGYTEGLAEGRGDAAIIRSADQEAEVAALRAQVRALENKCAKLKHTYDSYREAHGVDIDDTNDGYDSYWDGSDDDDGEGNQPVPRHKVENL
ncbi:hypothetical protein FKP32DRAFT_1605947 [Trametes sanguinea]|nr:hypothetical protein FKP32DRAFT_1605947 [Trametes sanguinea]